MPRGARPGERRGGRAKGALNKFTIGEAYRARQARSLDNTLLDLSRLLIATVTDPQDRQRVCHAIDRYIFARERASKQEKRGRSVVKGVPSPRRPFETFQLSDSMPLLEPDFTSLDLSIFDGAR
jgi:hypothetical protein